MDRAVPTLNSMASEDQTAQINVRLHTALKQSLLRPPRPGILDCCTEEPAPATHPPEAPPATTALPLADPPNGEDNPEQHADVPDADPRRTFYRLAPDAIQRKTISAEAVNELVALANTHGWAAALAQLQHTIAIAEVYSLT